MTDDPSTIVWRLGRVEDAVRDLGQRVVPADLYARDRAELERDNAELRAQLAEEKLARKEALDAERTARKEADQDLKAQVTSQGTNWRTAVYSGLVPGVLLLITVLLQLKSGSGK